MSPPRQTPHPARTQVAFTALCLLGMTGCALQQQAVVYQKPNAAEVQQQRAAKDMETCRQLADTTVGLNARRAENAAQGAARVGTIGFASTAVAGLMNSSRDVWKRARAGAAAGATGAAVKTLLEWNDADGVHRKYVERCMDDRGHDVLGWR